MNNRLADKLSFSVRDSIRGQLLSVLIGLLFMAAVVLAIAFYIQARSSSLHMLEGTYRVTGSMVARLSAYDFQFHKEGLKTTLDALVQSDPDIVWAEFLDTQGTSLQKANTAVKQPPTESLGAIPAQTEVRPVDTSDGKALLVRSPIVGTASQEGGDFGGMGFGDSSTPAKGGEKVLGELRVVVSLKVLKELRRGYFLFGAFIILLTLVAGSAVSLAVTRYMVSPIDQLRAYASKIAEGNLSTGQVRADRRDEMGRLVLSFQAMAGNLSGMVRQIRTAFQSIQGETEAVRKILNHNLDSNRSLAEATQQVAERMTAIQKSAEAVSSLMEGLSQIAEEVSSSVIQMITSIDEIARNSEGLTESVNTSASTLTQNVAAIREITASVDTLNRFVEETSASMTEMEVSIRQVEQNAADSRKASEVVLLEAQEATRAMERSEALVGQLQASFSSTVEVMRLLDQRSEEVGNILSVIDEVMEQTHLLALNAAIIAAQAGEHGKSFAVVAGEIRALAEKTSLSTREISDLIDSVQKEVQRAVDAVSSQTELVEQTVTSARDTRSALDRIQASVSSSGRMVQEIARATAEQTKGAAGIVHSSEQVRDQSHQLRRATQEQLAGSEQILQAVNRIRSLSEEVKRATKEQSAGSAIIRRAMDNLTNSVGKVMAQTLSQTQASKDVEKLMSSASQTGRSNVASLQQAVEQVESLTRRAEDLGRELARFRTEGS